MENQIQLGGHINANIDSFSHTNPISWGIHVTQPSGASEQTLASTKSTKSTPVSTAPTNQELYRGLRVATPLADPPAPRLAGMV